MAGPIGTVCLGGPCPQPVGWGRRYSCCQDSPAEVTKETGGHAPPRCSHTPSRCPSGARTTASSGDVLGRSGSAGARSPLGCTQQVRPSDSAGGDRGPRWRRRALFPKPHSRVTAWVSQESPQKAEGPRVRLAAAPEPSKGRARGWCSPQSRRRGAGSGAAQPRARPGTRAPGAPGAPGRLNPTAFPAGAMQAPLPAPVAPGGGPCMRLRPCPPRGELCNCNVTAAATARGPCCVHLRTMAAGSSENPWFCVSVQLAFPR